MNAENIYLPNRQAFPTIEGKLKADVVEINKIIRTIELKYAEERVRYQATVNRSCGLNVSSTSWHCSKTENIPKTKLDNKIEVFHGGKYDSFVVPIFEDKLLEPGNVSLEEHEVLNNHSNADTSVCEANIISALPEENHKLSITTDSQREILKVTDNAEDNVKPAPVLNESEGLKSTIEIQSDEHTQVEGGASLTVGGSTYREKEKHQEFKVHLESHESKEITGKVKKKEKKGKKEKKCVDVTTLNGTADLAKNVTAEDTGSLHKIPSVCKLIRKFEKLCKNIKLPSKTNDKNNVTAKTKKKSSKDEDYKILHKTSKLEDNIQRKELFRKKKMTYLNQTMPENQFESKSVSHDNVTINRATITPNMIDDTTTETKCLNNDHTNIVENVEPESDNGVIYANSPENTQLLLSSNDVKNCDNQNVKNHSSTFNEQDKYQIRKNCSEEDVKQHLETQLKTVPKDMQKVTKGLETGKTKKSTWKFYSPPANDHQDDGEKNEIHDSEKGSVKEKISRIENGNLSVRSGVLISNSNVKGPVIGQVNVQVNKTIVKQRKQKASAKSESKCSKIGAIWSELRNCVVFKDHYIEICRMRNSNSFTNKFLQKFRSENPNLYKTEKEENAHPFTSRSNSICDKQSSQDNDELVNEDKTTTLQMTNKIRFNNQDRGAKFGSVVNKKTRSGPVSEKVSVKEHSNVAPSYSIFGGCFPTDKNVIQLLRDTLKQKYGNTDSWKNVIPWERDPKDLPETMVYNLLYSRKKISPEGDKFNNHIITNVTSGTKVLIIGDPRFGKSTLCSLLSYHWSVSAYPISKFKLCLLIRLGHLTADTTDLATYIINECTTMLQDHNIGYEQVQTSLQEATKEIVIILDGYDQVPENLKPNVQLFFESNSFFNKSTVILTSRPQNEGGIPIKFNKHVQIWGVSAKRLRMLLEITRVPRNRIQRFCEMIEKDGRFERLQDLTPNFEPFIWNTVDSNDLSDETQHCQLSLYELLEKVLLSMMQQVCQKNESVFKNLHDGLIQLGRLFLDALLTGQKSFKESSLRIVLGTEFQHFLECDIFYEERNVNATEKIWTVTSQLLMVFLSTVYLRDFCSKLKSARKKKYFLKKAVCLSGEKGTYLDSNTMGPSRYYVGTVREIIVCLGRKTLWEKATINMCYDVENLNKNYLI